MIQMLSKNMNRKNKGFTLVELIIVIAIIAILVAVLLPRFAGFTDKAKKTQYLTYAKQIATAADSLLAEGKTLTANDVQDLAGLSTLPTGVTLTLDVTGTDAGMFSLTVGTTASPGPSSGSWYFGRTTATSKVDTLSSAITVTP